MNSNPWFRFYTEAIDDEKLGLLAFEDRWHFVAILCLKGKGVLDSEPDLDLLNRKVALKMGLSRAELENVVHRLSSMGLVDKKTYQPSGWAERQYESDSSRDRTRAYRERLKAFGRHGDVTVTVQEAEAEAEADTKKKKKAPEVAPPDGVSDSVWQDFLKHRKAKKAVVTQTAIEGIKREADKAGFTMEQALSECCMRGWVGFRSDWLSASLYAKPERPTTVPGTDEIDPALAKIAADRKLAVPMPKSIRDAIAAATRKGVQA